MLSLFQKILATLKSNIGGKIDYDHAWGNQCVDYARWYAKEIGHPIGTFGGSAYNGWKTGVPFIGTKWKRVEYKKQLPPRGAIVFFNKVPGNPYGHVAVVQNSNSKYLTVSEQNAGNGNGDGKGENKISIRMKTYKDVLGWYELP